MFGSRKDAYYASDRTGLAVCLKNSGIGVGLPDTGRVILEVRDGKVRIRTGGMYRSRYGDYGYSSVL